MILHPAHLTDLLITVGIIGVTISGLIFYTRIVAKNVATIRDNHLRHQAEVQDKTFETVTRIETKVNEVARGLDNHLDDHLSGRI